MFGLGKEKNKVMDCSIDEQGIETCRVAVKEKDGTLTATGTEFSTGQDDSCNIHLVGAHRIVNDDKAMIIEHINERVAACKRMGVK